jgi:hypothetical protein
MAGTPPTIKPSTKRPARRSENVGAKGTSIPTRVATLTEIEIAFTLPMRSANADHGMTPIARPTVDAEINSAALAAPTPKSFDINGNTACGEYSCANVAMPAQNSAASSLP